MIRARPYIPATSNFVDVTIVIVLQQITFVLLHFNEIKLC